MPGTSRSERWLVVWLEELVPEELRRDPLRRRQALITLGFVVAVFVVGCALVPVLLFIADPTIRLIAMLNTLASIVLMALAVVPLRRWHSVWLAGNWLSFVLYVGLLYAVVEGHGVRAPFTATLTLLPVFAGVIAGRRSGVAWGVIAALTVAAVLALDLGGVELPNNSPTGDALEILAAGALVATIALLTWMTSFSETTKEDAIERIREASARLEIAVQEEEKARVAADKAIAANTAKSAFLATMSHELRTPLNAILGYSEMVLDSLDARGAGEAEVAADIRRVHAAGTHLLGLITDVLDLTRIEADRMEFTPTEFDPAPLLRELADIFQPLAQRNGHTLVLDAPESLGLVFHDLTRVRQVLINLVGNAIKFTHQGSVTLRGAADEHMLTFTVEDTGIGIPPVMLEQIFEPFTQVDSSSTRRYEGTGLGLAITRKLVATMGGAIDARSAPNQGSTFTVRLPRRLPEPGAPK